MQILKSKIETIKKLLPTLPLLLIIPLLQNFKLNFIIGSTKSFFLADQIIIPLCAYKNLFTGICYCLIKTFMQSKPSNILLVYHIPTLLQIFYIYLSFSKNNFIKKSHLSQIFLALICITCIILFALHPIGSQASLYTMFWIIPIINSLFNHKNFFLHTLSGTLLSHAVGSVIWIYFKNSLTPAIWIGLIPVVFVERLLIASSATTIHKLSLIITRTRPWIAFLKLLNKKLKTKDTAPLLP